MVRPAITLTVSGTSLQELDIRYDFQTAMLSVSLFKPNIGLLERYRLFIPGIIPISSMDYLFGIKSVFIVSV